MDIAYARSNDTPPVPLCPSCSRPMRFVRAIPRFAALPELRTHECKACAVTYTDAVEPVVDRDDETVASTEPAR
jgi:hypothetical protein